MDKPYGYADAIFSDDLAACHGRLGVAGVGFDGALCPSACFFGRIGAVLMLALLGLGVIKTGMVERGAKWVLGELVFSLFRLWFPYCNTAICFFPKVGGWC